MKRTILTLAVTGCMVASMHGMAALVAPSADVETWRATELAFESGADYDVTGADSVMFDAVFTHESGDIFSPAADAVDLVKYRA